MDYLPPLNAGRWHELHRTGQHEQLTDEWLAIWAFLERATFLTIEAEAQKLLEELNDFIARVTEVAEAGPPPPDAKTIRREVDARYVMDLDDGVMVNGAALWPLLDI